MEKYRQLARVLLVVTCAFADPQVFAQAVSGTIVGTVTDESGAVVPNANVVISLAGQNVSHTRTTNESGNFTEPNLEPGTYSVVITANGFKRQAYDNIAVPTNTTQRVDAALARGNASEEITVTAAPPALQTDRADISTSIEQH
jgi:hypothetical protein